MRFFFAGWSHLVPSSLEGELVSIGFSMLASPIFFSLVFELVTVFGLFKVKYNFVSIDILL